MARLLFLMAAIILVVGVGAYRWYFQHRTLVTKQPIRSDLSPGLADSTLLTPPEPFGYKTAWFAIHSEDVDGVARALGLQHPQRTNWEYGVFHAYNYNDYQIFVTLPVNGWILAMGDPILWEADSHATQRMIELSRQFGEVQFFASMRTSNSYLWERAAKGRLLRSFRDEDGQRRTFGDESVEEKQVGKFADPSAPESQEPGYWKRKDIVFPDEQCVLKVAALWSIDPSQLDRMGLPKALGLLGDPSASYPPKPEPIRPANRSSPAR